MAGHSHFANIMHKKGRADIKRGKAFSKYAKVSGADGRDEVETNEAAVLAKWVD